MLTYADVRVEQNCTCRKGRRNWNRFCVVNAVTQMEKKEGGREFLRNLPAFEPSRLLEWGEVLQVGEVL